MSDAEIWLLDIGNTRGKWLCVAGDSALRRGHFETGSWPPELAVATPALVLVASVAAESHNLGLRQYCEQRGHRIWFARSKRELAGLSNSYAEPLRMGVDRWLAMLAAWRRSAGRCCVIDAGSALTLDFIDATGAHEGGYIIPGLRLMEQSLLGQTDRVRFDKSVSPALKPGRSTAEAVAHGAALALVGSVEAALRQASERGEAPRVYLCGGDAPALKSLLSTDCQRVDDLVYEGLAVQARLEGVITLSAIPELIAAP